MSDLSEQLRAAASNQAAVCDSVGGSPRPREQDCSAFFDLKLKTTETKLVQVAQAAGFQVVDVNLTFERDALGEFVEQKPDRAAANLEIAEFEPPVLEHREAARAIARRSFQLSRFHADPNLSQELASQLKADWIDNSFSGKRGQRVWVAMIQAEMAGFLTVIETMLDDTPIAVIDLIAVGQDFRNRGIGAALSSAFVEHYRVRSMSQKTNVPWRLRVGTQAANTAAQRLYVRQGFLPAQTAFVLHAHCST